MWLCIPPSPLILICTPHRAAAAAADHREGARVLAGVRRGGARGEGVCGCVCSGRPRVRRGPAVLQFAFDLHVNGSLGSLLRV